MTPFYKRLPKVPGVSIDSTADKVGAGLAAATAAGILAHGIGRAISSKKKSDDSDTES